ncbi:hypothetical protein HF086_005881 [Spodoptera exigua]|uniref:Protein kinase domain-containing protein n=1 Tax=Spodoptera exigua TaxID=7107 RepID=A0A922MA24_SPOEX|nr:hypothetical protein HF086_005881 [Spodoptera exigua]
MCAVLLQHGVHAGSQGVGPCGWYSASAAPAPTAPARLKRTQPPHQLPCGGSVSGSNGPHAPLSPTALQNSIPHNIVMSSSVRTPAPPGPAPSAMHTSQTTSAVSKGPSDVLVNSTCVNPPPAGNRLINMTQWPVKWATAPDNQNQRLTIDDEEFFDNMTDLIHQPPPYPPTPSVSSALSSGHFQHTYSTQMASSDQTDSSLQPQNFVDARWKIDERDLEIRENIGKGEFGDVMLGILNGSQKVAVKILKDREAASKFRAEASVMASLTHDNLVRLLGLVFTSSGSTCIVTEHCAQGSLLDYLRSRGRHYVTQLNQINFA